MSHYKRTTEVGVVYSTIGRKRRNILTVIFILWLLPLLVYVSDCTFNLDYEEGTLNGYFEFNSSELDITDNGDFTNFSMIYPYLLSTDVFLMGEDHATHKAYQYRLKLIKYFHQQGGIRYFLTEQGYGASIIINHYFETGDEEILLKFMNPFKNSYCYSVEFYETLRAMKEYNQSLANDQKVYYLGIDLEFGAGFGIWGLYLLLPDPTEPEPPYIAEIRTLFFEFDQLQFQYDQAMYYKVKKLIVKLAAEIEKNETLYRDYLQENYDSFKIIVDNLINAYTYRDSNDWNIREAAIYSNFIKIYHQLPETIPKKFFGQFGEFHVSQMCSPDELRIGCLLQHEPDSPVREKVITLSVRLANSAYMKPETGESVAADEEVYIPQLLAFALGEETLFRLEGDQSPFAETLLYLASTHQHLPDTVTTDYFQFLFLVQNSEAAQFYGTENTTFEKLPNQVGIDFLY